MLETAFMLLMNSLFLMLISREELLDFYKEYKGILPDSITKWEEL